MQITIDLTEEQENFLKEFAAKYYPNSRDNVLTSKPIHLVQKAGNAKKAKGIENKIDDDKTCFTCNFLIDHFVCEIHGEIKDENNHVCNNYQQL